MHEILFIKIIWWHPQFGKCSGSQFLQWSFFPAIVSWSSAIFFVLSNYINLKYQLCIYFLRMFYTGSARTFTSYTISGCFVKLRWNLINASLYEIYITSQNNSNFQIYTTTSEHTYVFVAVRQGVYYTLKWAPVYGEGKERYRGNTSEQHTVFIAKGKVESCKTEFGKLFKKWVRSF